MYAFKTLSTKKFQNEILGRNKTLKRCHTNVLSVFLYFIHIHLVCTIQLYEKSIPAMYE